MPEFVHHPSNHGHHTGKTIPVKPPLIPRNSKPLTAKPLTAKTAKTPYTLTNKKPLIVKTAGTGWTPHLPEVTKTTRPLAESILACLLEDLPAEYVAQIDPRSDGHCDININLGSPLKSQQVTITAPAGLEKEEFYGYYKHWMFTLAIIGSNLSLVRNHDGPDFLIMGFVLEDPDVFTKIVATVKDWTVIDLSKTAPYDG